ncbi:laminin subunit beta-4 isoform X1 [Vombatus ursinus]|uniref:Laminin subunit beta-2 n=1 Tax=Vombatus ursinus TaxID=29139 RepID=A0A4X2KMA7_VOMUR|nr:laminin subunit beta-4 isoform X1 [Vombatus ursinus]XP_027694669.1 laminin subunit beta-4 isoform X1 [Vombatus ursinus]XP_027694671.1 laminin subunit beta-4 isoform X1 [Vombatus ursinus]XP_027694672.1 laminin subunit beta-4 isoform X1 [Vombatus ursinus]
MKFQLTFFMPLVLFSLSKAQDDCSSGSCHPIVGDLLVGRSAQLTASSTCGLDGPQKYCIIGYLEDEQKCFICDSRYPYNPYTQANSHAIENVITTFEPERKKKWWQSENGLNNVSIRLDLETLFQFSHLILTFKTFRPAAMLVERSVDYGQTWKVFRYFAKDCAASFPNISSGQAQGVDDLVCDSKYSDIEPSTEGEVVLKALDPSFEIENPYSPYIQDLVTLTNLRINFTKLHTLGDTLLGRRPTDPLDKYYYAVYDMVVRGRCFCNGHANRCGPVQDVRGDVFSPSGMVHGQCICQHNTDGPNCERCKEFFHDVPWRPAEGLQDNACRSCNCNGHSERCHFDMSLYLSNNGVSGGVCEDCQHNTVGQHCDQCKPLFYRDLLKAISDPHACIPCECDPEGSLSGGMCESYPDPALGIEAGRCLCKDNVEGAQCDQCKPGYYGLNANDPLGCQPCNCNPFGSVPFSTCDAVTGQCLCQQFAIGPHCEECLVGYWGLKNNLHGCSPCDCDIGGAYSNLCSPHDGQCECRPHIIGPQCTEPEPGYFFVPLDFYIYEAEDAIPISRSAPLILATVIPHCEVYFQKQGGGFTIDSGNIILERNKIKSSQEQSEVTVTFDHAVIKEPIPGKPVTWTGPGFSQVFSGTSLRFTINNIPYAMDYIIAVRYEPQSSADWAAHIVINPSGASRGEHCKYKALPQEPQTLALLAFVRIALLATPVCLEPEMQYSVDVHFSQSQTHGHILIDSLGLIPQIDSVENFCNKQHLDEHQLNNCIEIASKPHPQILPDWCERLIVSISARIHNGAVACQCHPKGSIGSSCSKLGGQCQCKAHVVGRCCDQCSEGAYGLGHHGCHSCECHPQGSKSTMCDQVTGQCSCHRDIEGRHCDQCSAGYFGFPNCQPCPCNGFTELCDPETGSCFNCRGFTAGHNCERCIDGYYGNPLSGKPCLPCQCPDVPSSNQYFAHSCYQNSWNLEIICNCQEGYTGIKCDECSTGFYGNPRISGDLCLPCACNNNIDRTDSESCNGVTGECLKCLHNTHGPNCQFCKPGYFGSALTQNCRKCDCNPSGVNHTTCPMGDGACLCDPTTGSCPCLPNVIGLACDQCAKGYWNLVPGRGCQFCECDPQRSHNTHCNQFTGQCPCKLGYGGKHCNKCEENYYGDPQVQCIECKCNKEGTQTPICDQETGSCLCRTGVMGQFCDRCARGHSQEFPTCLRCHLCFDQWDNKISSLSEAVQGLIRLAANLEDKRETLPGCNADIKRLEDSMSEIERILKHPVFSSGEFLNVKDYHDSVRIQVEQIAQQLNKAYDFQDLNGTVMGIGKEVDNLLKDLQKKVHLSSHVGDSSIRDASKIKKYYQMSLSMEQKINETTLIMKHSENTRNDLLTMIDGLTSKADFSLEKLKQIQTPDIQKLNEKVCGIPGNLSCLLAPCGGALCKDAGGHRICGGPSCNGSLGLSGDAVKKSEETESMINNLTNQLQVSENQIRNITKLTQLTKTKALQLTEKLENMKDQIELGQQRTKALLHNVKDFLLDENVPPEDIEKVANHVLDLHLPITLQNLTKGLDKIELLTKLCEDDHATTESRLKLKATEVQKLLAKSKEAEEAVNTLLNLEEMLKNLQHAESVQGQANSTIKKLTDEIQKIEMTILKAENFTNKTDDELEHIASQQSTLEDEISTLQTKIQRTRDSAISAKAQAESAQGQAHITEKDLIDLKKQFTVLQDKTNSKGFVKGTLSKVKQLKEEAEKLVGETKEKMQRIKDLEKKIRVLNQTKQEKVNQLKQLENHVIAIKNEIAEQENKYATCHI